MGILEWLGIRKADAKPAEPPKAEHQLGPDGGQDAAQKAGQQQQTQLPSFKKPSDWKFPRENIRFMSDSEKINLILQGVYSVYDELRPMADDGSRISRLQLLLENLTPTERDAVKSRIEELDIDNAIVRFLDYPKSIEEISGQIRKSYGYTAARLRHLRATGRVARLRDPVSNKYKYTRISEGSPAEPIAEPEPAAPAFVDELATEEPKKQEATVPAEEPKPAPESPA